MNREESILLGKSISKFEVNRMMINGEVTLRALDLKKGWNYVLEHLDEETSLATLLDIHDLVAKSDLGYNYLGSFNAVGNFRKKLISIMGSDYIPEIPDVNMMHEELSKIQEIKDPTDKGLTTILWTSRTQPFEDCNKRVASLTGNKILLENGIGAIVIPTEFKRVYIDLLLDFYETNEMGYIKDFMYNNCLITQKENIKKLIRK